MAIGDRLRLGSAPLLCLKFLRWMEVKKKIAKKLLPFFLLFFQTPYPTLLYSANLGRKAGANLVNVSYNSCMSQLKHKIIIAHLLRMCVCLGSGCILRVAGVGIGFSHKMG